MARPISEPLPYAVKTPTVTREFIISDRRNLFDCISSSLIVKLHQKRRNVTDICQVSRRFTKTSIFNVPSRTEITLHDASLLDMPYGFEINGE
jgi:hypothetical protein